MAVNKINGYATTGIAKLNGTAIGSIAKINGSAMPATSSFDFKTDDLEIWWRGDDADSNFYNVNASGVTIENQATVEGFSDPWTSTDPNYGDHRIINGTSGDFTTLTINSQSVGVISLDGSNDNIITRELQVGSQNASWNHPYPPNSSAVVAKNNWYDITQSSGSGFTVELWFRSNGNWASLGNILSCFNECFRLRMSGGQLVAAGSRIFGTWNTGWNPSTNTWYQLALTYTPGASTGTSRLYVNGALEASITAANNMSSSTWIRNTLLIGTYNTAGSEAQAMYVGLFRKYITPLTATEISDNYDADKATFGLS